MKRLQEKVVVITGAGSGIGRALSVEAAGLGCALALADKNPEALEQTMIAVNGVSPHVSGHLVDVASQEAIHDFARSVVDTHKVVDILINNAGVLLCETVEDVSLEEFQWLMSVNFWSVVNVTKSFLPILKERQEAHIVNMSSVAGLVTTPCNGPYAISKAAVKAFTETLNQELRGTGIGVSCVLAGGVKTNIFKSAPKFRSSTSGMTSEQCAIWYETAAKTTPEQAARTIIKGIQRNKSRILIGADARMIDLLCRIAPSRTNFYAGLLMSNLNRFRPPWVRLTRAKGTN